jgi:ketosteroid isomerase-like protein
VKLVRRLLPAPEVDVAPLFRDDEKWGAVGDALARRFHTNIECHATVFDGDRSRTGVDGFRAIWLEWLTPWATYRQELDDIVDLGDRVVMLLHDFGRPEGSRQEVEIRSAAVWTLSNGKVSRWHAYLDRAEALEVVGLE